MYGLRGGYKGIYIPLICLQIQDFVRAQSYCGGSPVISSFQTDYLLPKIHSLLSPHAQCPFAATKVECLGGNAGTWKLGVRKDKGGLNYFG